MNKKALTKLIQEKLEMIIGRDRFLIFTDEYNRYIQFAGNSEDSSLICEMMGPTHRERIDAPVSEEEMEVIGQLGFEMADEESDNFLMECSAETEAEQIALAELVIHVMRTHYDVPLTYFWAVHVQVGSFTSEDELHISEPLFVESEA